MTVTAFWRGDTAGVCVFHASKCKGCVVRRFVWISVSMRK